MQQPFLVVTSIANHDHQILNELAEKSAERNLNFIVIGDVKSPKEFQLSGCDFFSVEKQSGLTFQLAQTLPLNHYSRKNLGYLVAISRGAEVIIETDDDNVPLSQFWDERSSEVTAHLLDKKGWVNIYKYFSESHIWPRGFALENILDKVPDVGALQNLFCPIQQGLADDNPDVDAIYRLTLPLPITFDKGNNIALGKNSICPFNSQNTTWFKDAFPLMYLPSYCSFRMTDIWRSFVAQRIAWTCDWPILFHESSVRQERNDHDLMKDFRDEIDGYQNNKKIFDELNALALKSGPENIPYNMRSCYSKLIELGLVDSREMDLLNSWLSDLSALN